MSLKDFNIILVIGVSWQHVNDVLVVNILTTYHNVALLTFLCLEQIIKNKTIVDLYRPYHKRRRGY